MKILFEYNGLSYEHKLKNGIVKIYSVPVEYSDDGLYISDFSKKMLEPAPASISLETKLLYHGERRVIMGQEFMDEIKNELGEVRYAED